MIPFGKVTQRTLYYPQRISNTNKPFNEASEMQRNWSNRNVDLNKLTEKIATFFNENDFEVAITETPKGYRLEARSSPRYNVGGPILISVEGQPNEFSIEMELQIKKPSRIFQAPTLLALFGGGYFLTQRLKADEAWLKFRKSFWENMEKIISELSSSQAT
jgi:hypothetical protein